MQFLLQNTVQLFGTELPPDIPFGEEVSGDTKHIHTKLPPIRRAVSLLVNWFYQLVVHGRIQEQDYAALEQEIHSVQEVREMLIDAVAKEKQQLLEQGIEQGRVAMQRTLEQLLQSRFAQVPADISARLATCTINQLQALVNPAIDAATWEEFAKALPAPAE